jgi:hypothetical protein
MAETAEDLQNLLNIYADYCDAWRLKSNSSKTKVLAFSRGRQREYTFTLKNETLEIVNEYKYLCVLFNRSGSFFKTKQEIAKQATEAMYSLKKMQTSLLIQIYLFNKMVKPILLYGCEIWGFGNLDIVERVQLKFLKHILCLKNNTSNIILYCEAGTKPLSIEIKAKMISFWAKLIVTNYKKTYKRNLCSCIE